MGDRFSDAAAPVSDVSLNYLPPNEFEDLDSTTNQQATLS